MNRHALFPVPSQSRHGFSGSVDREGGGLFPTLGGGLRAEPAEGGMAP